MGEEDRLTESVSTNIKSTQGTKPTRPKVLPTESSIQPPPRQSQQQGQQQGQQQSSQKQGE